MDRCALQVGTGAHRQLGYQRMPETKSREMRPRAVMSSAPGNHMIDKAGKGLRRKIPPRTHSIACKLSTVTWLGTGVGGRGIT